MESITQTSTALLQGLKDSSNDSCWSEFDRRFRPLILAVALRMGLSQTDAQDAAQETIIAFLQSWRKNQYDKNKGRLRHWLSGICCHKIRDIQRKYNRKEKRISDITNATGFLNQIEDTNIQDLWNDEWEKMILQQCLREIQMTVTAKKYKAFELFTLQQVPASKVADQLGITEDSVYQNKRRILIKIRELMLKIENIY